MVQGMPSQSPTPFSWQQPPLKHHIPSCSSSPMGISQGYWKGMWPRSNQLDFLSWEAASIHNSVENRWKPLRLGFFKVTVQRTHCKWIPDSSLELFQVLSFQRLGDSVTLWNLWTIQNPSYKVLICWNQKVGLCCWQPMYPNMGKRCLSLGRRQSITKFMDSHTDFSSCESFYNIGATLEGNLKIVLKVKISSPKKTSMQNLKTFSSFHTTKSAIPSLKT